MRGGEVVLSAAIVFVSFALIARYFRPRALLEPNAIFVLYFFHITAQLGPASYMLFVDELPAAVRFFRACVATALLIPIGGLFVDVFIRRPRDAQASLYNGVLVVTDETARAARLFLSLLGAGCLVVFVMYLSRQEVWPLMTLLIDQTPNIARAERLLATPTAHGYLFGFAARFLMPVLFISIIANWRFLMTPWQRILAVGGALMVFVNNSYDGSKTLVVLLFLLAFFYWLTERAVVEKPAPDGQTTKMRWRRRAVPAALVASGVGYPLFIFLFLPAGQNESFGYLVRSGLVGRIFWRPAENAYLAFELFPEHFDYTNFLNISKVAWLFGAERFDLSRTVAVYKYGLEMNVPPPGIGGLHAQYGWPAIISGVLLAAMMFRGCETFLMRMHVRSPQVLAVYTFILFGAFRFSWGNLHAIFLSEAIFPAMMTLLVWESIRTGLLHHEARTLTEVAPTRQST